MSSPVDPFQPDDNYHVEAPLESKSGLITASQSRYHGVRGWAIIAFGTALSGGAYGVLVLMVEAVNQLFRYRGLASRWAAATDVFEGLIPVVAIGIALAGSIAIFVVPIIFLLARAMRVPTNIVTLGAIAGGLVGFLAATPFWATPYFHLSSISHLKQLASGPGITTIFGQIGGGIGGWIVNDMVFNEDGPASVFEALNNWRSKFRFGIRGLLWSTIILSLLLAIIWLSGVAFELAIPVLAGWIVYQAATRWIGWYVLLQSCRWWDAKQQPRST